MSVYRQPGSINLDMFFMNLLLHYLNQIALRWNLKVAGVNSAKQSAGRCDLTLLRGSRQPSG